jgi:phosphoribosyl-AMP cyclohydrolase
MHLDCDGDTILIKVDQKDRIACHTGAHSCFFLELEKTADGPVWKK